MSARRSVPVRDWPEADRLALERALAPTDIFEEPGPASGWGEATRRALIWRYGCWLAWLADAHPSVLALPPQARVSAARVRQFEAAFLAGLKSSSASQILTGAARLIEAIAPGADTSAFHQLARRHAMVRSPRPVMGRLRSPHEVVRLGFALMDEAARLKEGRPLEAALACRDGLMLALLAAVPLRRRNFTTLAIGSTLRREGLNWAIAIPASEAKGKRSLDYPVPDWLTAALDSYIAKWRPLIPGSSSHPLLWASPKGGGLVPTSLYATICRRTQAAFGQPINPHLFRTMAVTNLALHEPASIRLAAGLLGHARIETTEAHYRATQAIKAGHIFQTVIAGMKEPKRRDKAQGRRP